jgi:hypothetical protein
MRAIEWVILVVCAATIAVREWTWRRRLGTLKAAWEASVHRRRRQDAAEAYQRMPAEMPWNRAIRIAKRGTHWELREQLIAPLWPNSVIVSHAEMDPSAVAFRASDDPETHWSSLKRMAPDEFLRTYRYSSVQPSNGSAK